MVLVRSYPAATASAQYRRGWFRLLLHGGDDGGGRRSCSGCSSSSSSFLSSWHLWRRNLVGSVKRGGGNGGSSLLFLGPPTTFVSSSQTSVTRKFSSHQSTTHHPKQKRHLHSQQFVESQISSSSSLYNSSKDTLKEFFENQEHVVITYITDIEGDKAYLDRYVQISKVLTFVPTKGNNNNNNNNKYSFPYSQQIDFTNDHSMLVFGGDIWDKGGYDLYTIRQLLDLKRRYPHRVVFILGNRDVNKLRILQEIGIQDPPPPHPGLLWLRGTGRIGDPDCNDSDDDGKPSLSIPTDSVQRLQWMLSQTMGSPNAFEYRKQELEWEQSLHKTSMDKQQQQQQQQPISTVTDQQVVESYRSTCHPQGEMGQFLSQGQFISRLGPIVFLHGALPLTKSILDTSSHDKGLSVWDDFTPFMPWLPNGETAKDHGVTTIDQWMDALNAFCYRNMQEYQIDIEQQEQQHLLLESNNDDNDNNNSNITEYNSTDRIWAYKGGYGSHHHQNHHQQNHGRPRYSDLIQYGMGMLPTGQRNATVVYNSFTPHGMPHSFFPHGEPPQTRYHYAVQEFFHQTGITLLLAGHKPQGDMPCPIRVNNNNNNNNDDDDGDPSSWIVLADTSYSGDTLWYSHPSDDNGVVEEESIKEGSGNLGQGNSLSFRGDHSVSEVLIDIRQGRVESVLFHGVLSDGRIYESSNLVNTHKSSPIGQVAPKEMVPSEANSPHHGQWWTKCLLQDGSYLCHAGEGFTVWNYVTKSMQPASSNTTT